MLKCMIFEKELANLQECLTSFKSVIKLCLMSLINSRLLKMYQGCESCYRDSIEILQVEVMH